MMKKKWGVTLPYGYRFGKPLKSIEHPPLEGDPLQMPLTGSPHQYCQNGWCYAPGHLRTGQKRHRWACPGVVYQQSS